MPKCKLTHGQRDKGGGVVEERGRGAGEVLGRYEGGRVGEGGHRCFERDDNRWGARGGGARPRFNFSGLSSSSSSDS